MQTLMLPDGLAPDDFGTPPRVHQGTLALPTMPRLAPLLAIQEGQAWARLEGSLDDAGRRELAGRIEADVPLTCQRCLGVYYHPVVVAFRVVIVATEEEGEALPDELEPYVCGSAVRPLQVVEEEILLALPVVARHTGADCTPPEHEAGIAREALSPFASLQGKVRRHEADD
ncbi:MULTISPECIES: YceD family protein [Halorhodospira]|uniref:YceD family protein n=1 Tax=Halorhodospira TaxID=85108 RepID=UPI00191333BA|nr:MULTISPECIES: YceD family protein [Halorhodospira]MBK5942310.1 hypothetical protein [Halorhodospira halophila]MCG5537509.1 YceD family protein [Halorhodospira sp. 9622]